MQFNKKNKVLIVDDHPIMREGLCEIINREDDLVVCCEAEDIPQAMRAVNDCPPTVALVDLSLKNGSGLRLIENLSYAYPGIFILVYSMHDESIYAERCLKAGAKGYIMKQEPPRKLILALKKVLKGEIYISDNLSEKYLHTLFKGRDEAGASPVALLGNRELEIFQLLGQGVKKRVIADKLNLSLKTVENHVDHIKKKMKFRDFHELLRHAFKYADDDIKD